MNIKIFVLRNRTIRGVDDILEMRRNLRSCCYPNEKVDITKEMTKSYLTQINKYLDKYKCVNQIIKNKAKSKVIVVIYLSNIDDKETSADIYFLLHVEHQTKTFYKR